MVGYSGGADSTALLHALYEISKTNNFKLIAVHLNHNWRGEEAYEEQISCEKFCKNFDIEFYTETLAEGLKCTELDARNARYEFFENAAKKFNSNVLLTAHTKTDNAETLFYRIVKGTGLVGLKGIPEYREESDLKILRPMLSITRDDVEKYISENHLQFNSDSSNENVKYVRNFIRKKIFPELKTINKNLVNALEQLCVITKSELNLVDEYLKIIKKDLIENDKILTKKFLKHSKDLQLKLLYEIVSNSKTEYDYKNVLNLLNFIEKNSNSKNGKLISITNELWLFVSEKYIYEVSNISISKKKEIKIEKEGKYKFNNFIFEIEKYSNEKVSYQSAENLSFFVNFSDTTFPFVLRNWNKDAKSADFIQPFGMKGSMKLKKYFSNKYINKLERDKKILLCKNNEVLWVAGVGLSEKLKIFKTPTHKITLRIEDKNG